MTRVGMLFGVAGLVAVGLGWSSADDPPEATPALAAARAAHDKAVEDARNRMLAELDKWIANAKAAGKLDLLEGLTEQKKEFQADEVLPAATQLQTARTRYESSLRSAKRALVTALQRAEVALTKVGRLDEARDVREERQALEESLTAEAARKAPEAPDAQVQPNSRWTGTVVMETVDDKGKLVRETFTSEVLVKSRQGDRWTYRSIVHMTKGREDVIRESEGVFGKIQRGEKTRRRFTWGDGPGLREGWVGGNTIIGFANGGDDRWRSSYKLKLVTAP